VTRGARRPVALLSWVDRTLSNVRSSSVTTPLVALTRAGSVRSRAVRRAMALTVEAVRPRGLPALTEGSSARYFFFEGCPLAFSKVCKGLEAF